MDPAASQRLRSAPERTFWAATAGATATLLGVAMAVGLVLWLRRSDLRLEGQWQVAGVPASMSLLISATALVCLATATTFTRRPAGLGARDTASRAWFALLVGTAGVLGWNVVYSAAYAMQAIGAVIPVLSWLFTSVPALVAGLLFLRRGPSQRMAAAAGTGIVTVPLSGLSLHLLVPMDPWLPVDRWEALAVALPTTLLFCVVPLIASVAMAGSWGRDR